MGLLSVLALPPKRAERGLHVEGRKGDLSTGAAAVKSRNGLLWVVGGRLLVMGRVLWREVIMSGEACPLPVPPSQDEAAAVERLLKARRIAVVGLSDDPMRASFGVASYLVSEGLDVFPVNPNLKTVMGLKCYPSLKDVPKPIELVDVFRRPEYCADVVRDAIAAGAKGVWLQSGIVSAEAQRLAREAKIDFVQNRCLMVEHMHHGG